MPGMQKVAYSGRKNVQVIVKEVLSCNSIDSVVVYSDRAEVKREVPVKLEAGENEVIISDLPECIIGDSIRCVGQ